MNTVSKIKTSRFISFILRHKPDAIGLELDTEGYINVDDLLNGMNLQGYDINLITLKEIVSEDDKARYSFNGDFTKIRASQGHSIKVNSGLVEKVPPRVLYHGTGYKYLCSIMKEGLVKKSRQYVHLSTSTKVAEEVGTRHGESVILQIDSEGMYCDGFKFYISENGVWLTDNIPTKYLRWV